MGVFPLVGWGIGLTAHYLLAALGRQGHHRPADQDRTARHPTKRAA